MKIALHANGHSYFPPSPNDAIRENTQVSTPRTIRTHGEEGTRVPREILRSLHAFLQSVYPELAQLPFDKTRMCWYMDTPDEDWIIDDITNAFLSDSTDKVDKVEVGNGQGSRVIIATGGSGHAFKVSFHFTLGLIISLHLLQPFTNVLRKVALRAHTFFSGVPFVLPWVCLCDIRLYDNHTSIGDGGYTWQLAITEYRPLQLSDEKSYTFNGRADSLGPCWHLTPHFSIPSSLLLPLTTNVYLPCYPYNSSHYRSSHHPELSDLSGLFMRQGHGDSLGGYHFPR
jgi:hypothetical protein